MQEIKTGEVVIYKDQQGPELKVSLVDNTVWLSQSQMAELFRKDVRTINEHIKNIFKEAELRQNSVIRKFRITALDGKTYNVNYYNLDVIISVGYRVKSKRGTQFRIWATQRLRDYLLKGYILNQHRLKERREIKLKELEGALKLIQRAIETNRLSGSKKLKPRLGRGFNFTHGFGQAAFAPRGRVFVDDSGFGGFV